MPNYADYVNALAKAQQTTLFCAVVGVCLVIPLIYLSPRKRRAYALVVWYVSLAGLAALGFIIRGGA